MGRKSGPVRRTEQRVRVLLVEDSELAATLIQRRLDVAEGWQVSCVCAPDLETASAHLAHHWDVVLLDLGLPGCEGLEALEWFRRYAPSLPVVDRAG